MDKSVRERERKQFKALIWLGFVAYPFWFAYGVWSGNYDAQIIVGFIAVWAGWYIKYVKTTVEADIIDTEEQIDWHSCPVDKYINIKVLVISLSTTMILCISILVFIEILTN